MSGIFIHGLGAVSPAGWGVPPLREALAKTQPLPIKELARPGWSQPLRIRSVPTPAARPAFLAHPRLRRTSPITQFTVAAALEALGKDTEVIRTGALRLGIVVCVMTGCVNYSRRFYDEVLRDPATASPLIFPETVFNAPASHLAAVLGTTAINYTLVGDPSAFLQGVALAAEWLADGRVEGCLVVGAEENDWLTADAFRLFTRETILSEGAGALYLRREPATAPTVELRAITGAHFFFDQSTRCQAAARVRAELPGGSTADALYDSAQNVARLDAAETTAWRAWPGQRCSPKKILGEGLMAAAAWQCVLAADRLRDGTGTSALVSVVGCNQQAIGAAFGR